MAALGPILRPFPPGFEGGQMGLKDQERYVCWAAEV
jgi:hypothetical protein